jgi:hypothetical protein
MKSVSILALSAMGILVACSGGATTEQDRGVEGAGDPAAAAPDKNPDGKPYPTTNIGTRARSGKTPGNTIANYKFMGYPDGDVTKGFVPLSLASYFDPAGTKFRMIHIQASGSWCVHCQKETETVTPLRQQLLDRKVVWIISLAEGSVPGTPSTVTDLKKWVAEFKAPYTHFLDPGNRNLGPFYDAAALPWNATIDARTMEIVDAHVGGAETESDLLGEVDDLLGKLDALK